MARSACSAGKLRNTLHALRIVICAWFCVWALASCALPTPAPLVTLIPTFTPQPVPTWTPLPTPTATATPLPPTPDPATLLAEAEAGAARIQAAAGDAQVLCFRHEDTDGDGAPEWLALTYQEAEPYARLRAFILDEGNTFYALPTTIPDPATPDYGLGQYATCEIEIRDVNADGRPEVAIFGHADENQTLMHLYGWENGDYRVLGNFHGNAGVRFADADGDLAEEVIEGHRERNASDLAWYVVFTWNGGTYGWTWDYYDWYSLERPHTPVANTPEYAVISFYALLDDRDMARAYALLTPEYQSARPFDGWVAGFGTTLRIEAGSVHAIPTASGAGYARVAVMVTSWDNEDGRVIARVWNVEWDTILTTEGWQLTGGTQQLLDSQEALYWQ